ncbi:DNA primase [Breznakibacter xylanolyticus]|uniref:DNA primase n=1 Tax=Breznakibacter xylanolyticus TaxID=990 RepID=A0A2W7NZM1_9BACT|nr:DNA primase [Breznakibacter xylanolyticus]PZX16662.1 DNA primase [Breznakibacter xylanolyticus]
MIDQSTIDRVMDAAQAQIVDIVSEFISLKRRGTNYIGNCPFHNEKTPSFMVSPAKGIFKCFGCGKGGNGLHFVMEHEQLTFVDAIRYLGKKFHIPIEETEVSPQQEMLRNERESMMVVSSFAQKFFENTMFQTDEGQSVGLSYFRSRGFRDDIIRKFQLGYSPEERDAFIKEALKNGFKQEFIEKTGLGIFKDDYRADRFRGRVMFPIHNLTGKVIAFGGRVLKTDAKTAKYLNSPESDIYHKSRILYGIYQAKQEIVKQNRCFLVEGYTDVISMHQAGITNVVASSGTALTQDQILLIKRFTPNITILYDGDPAGIKAALRGIDLVLEEGMNVKVLLLPDGDDPDSFSRKMPAEQLIEYINQHETDFIRFKTGLLLQDAKNDPIKRASLIQDIVKTIFTIPDPIVRSVYIKECSNQLDVQEPVLYAELTKLTRQKREQESNRQPIQRPDEPPADLFAPPDVFAQAQSNIIDNKFEIEEREVLRYLVKFANFPLTTTPEGDMLSVGEFIVRELKIDDLQSTNPTYNRMLDIFSNAHNQGIPVTDMLFINHTDVNVAQMASDLVSRQHQLSKIHARFGTPKSEEDLLTEIVPKVVLELKNKKVILLLEENSKQIKKAQEEKNIDRLMQLMVENQKWQIVKKTLASLLGGRIIVK